MQARHTIHLTNPKRQQATEGARNRRSTEEHSLSQLNLLTLIPVRQVVRNTRKQASLGDTKHDARRHEAAIVRDNSHERHDDAPCNHDGGQPDGGPDLFEHEVAGHFEDGVGEEEGGQAPVVLVVCEFEVFLQAFDFGVADVPACFIGSVGVGVVGCGGREVLRTVEE